MTVRMILVTMEEHVLMELLRIAVFAPLDSQERIVKSVSLKYWTIL